MKNLLAVLVVACVALSGCAEHKHHREVYVSKSGGYRTIGDFRIRLMVLETHKNKLEGAFSKLVFLMSNTNEESGFPYELLVVSDYSGESKEATRILGLEMQVGSEMTVNLLTTRQNLIEISNTPVAETIYLPLGDRLPFRDGQQVTFTMIFQPPGSEETTTVKYVFEGTTKTNVYTTGDVINSV